MQQILPLLRKILPSFRMIRPLLRKTLPLMQKILPLLQLILLLLRKIPPLLQKIHNPHLPKNPRPTQISKTAPTKTSSFPNPFLMNTIFTKITHMHFMMHPGMGLRLTSRLQNSAASRAGISQ